MTNKKNRLPALSGQPFFTKKKRSFVVLLAFCMLVSGFETMAKAPKSEPDGTKTEKESLGEGIIVGNEAVVFYNNRDASVFHGKGSRIIADVAGNGESIIRQSHYRDEALTEFIIPQGVKRIEDFAFARSGLQQIVIPEGVTAIDYAAFYHCKDLKSVTIPTSVTKIGAQAFGKTLWLENWLLEKDDYPYLIVGDGILLAYRGSQKVLILPEEIKQIGANAFVNHTELVEVSLPKDLVSIGQSAFEGCSNLKILSGGAAPSIVEEKAFEGCQTSLEPFTE